MGILDRLGVDRLAQERLLDLMVGPTAAKAGASSPMTTQSWQQSEARAEQWTIPDGSVYTRQAELYKKLSWVQIAVSAVAKTVGTTPFSVKELVGEDEKDIPNHDFELLLQKPNPLQSRYELLYATAAWFKLTGNYYWWLNRASEHDAPSELWLIPSNKIRPIPDGNLFLRGYLYDPGQGIGKIVLEPWEVMHGYTFNPFSMFVGLSPIEAIAISATGDLKMQEWNTNFFGRDNAKVPGFLAFKDAIGDADWERLKAETKQEHGGTKRSLMMVRGAGAGGVEWVATSMSQADMEFLGGRTFNMEEIYSLYAPGLASMLAVNATEANSIAGRATFLEMAVWPDLVAIAEKVTNDLLPSYGTDIVGEFDNIRHTDRTLELEEQKAYERTHTIDEVRKQYGGDKPIGDERGSLLVAEVPTARVSAKDPNAAITGETDVSVPPTSDTAPQETPPAVSPGEAAVAQSNKAADLDKWQRKATKALKQGRSAAVAFESEYLNGHERETVYAALATATDEETIKAAFQLHEDHDRGVYHADPRQRMETVVGLGKVRDVVSTKAATLTPAEQALMDRIRAILTQHGKTAAAAVVNGSVPPLDALSSDLRAAIQSAVVQAVVERATELADTIGVDFDEATVASAAGDWAEKYTYDLVGGLTDASRTVLQKAVASYQASPMTRDDLVRRLAPVFGDRRAETIAITEISRASNQGTVTYQSYLKDNGLEFERVWQTANDDDQCAICGPLNQTPEDEWSAEFPDGGPAHPRCRCSTSLRLKGEA